jgi:hypothetical protein
MFRKSLMMALGLLIGSLAAAQDAPDIKKEEKFHDIYKTYNEQPTSEEVWEHAVGDRQSQVYRVQKGDTLSDISRTLFGDQFYWPKIWSFNTGDITNPHEIKPNMNIQFFPGNMSDAPTLDMVDSSQAPEGVIAASDAGLAEAGPVISKPGGASIPIPPSKKSHAALMKVLPPSLPSHRFPTAPEYLTYVVSNDPPPSIGKVVETELGMSSAGDFQYVIVHMDDPSQKNLTVFKHLEPVIDPTRADSNGKAELIEYQGEIEVLDKVNADDNLYRAMVKKTIQPVEVGAVLKVGHLPMFDPSSTEVASGAKAVIIGGQFSNKRDILNSRSLVFLSAGSAQGMQEGQSLAVFGNLKKRLPETKVQTNARQIGVVKIVNVSQNYSTAYVTHAEDDISVGDFVGSNVSMASAGGSLSPATDATSSVKDELDEFNSTPDSPAAPATTAPAPTLSNTEPNTIPDMKTEDPLNGSSGNDSDFDF